MYHIKTFESHSEEDDNYWDDYLSKLNSENNRINRNLNDAEKYYTLLSEAEAGDAMLKMINIETPEVIKIRDLFNDKYIVERQTWGIYDEGRTHQFTYIEAKKRLLQNFKENFWIKIWRLPDEYYLVCAGDDNARVFDLCDQFEGLVYLINQIGAGVDTGDRWTKTFELFENDDKGDCSSVLEYQLKEWLSTKKLENFSQEEKNNIQKWFGSISPREKIIMGDHTFNYEVEYGSLIHISANVRKYDDEWFVVTYYELIYNSRIHRQEEEAKYYLCDQQEGLHTFSKLLRHEVNTNYKMVIKNEGASNAPDIEVSKSEYDGIRGKHGYDKFTQYEISKIGESIPNNYDFIVKEESYTHLGYPGSIGSSGSIKRIGDHFSKFFIDKLTDEYFTIQLDMGIKIDKYWIADGFDELIDWIRMCSIQYTN